MQSTADSYDTELRRVVDRLRSLPIARLQSAQGQVEQLAAQLLECSRAMGSPAPATVPELGAWAYGDMIMVLGTDLRELAEIDDALAPGLAALTSARQQLP